MVAGENFLQISRKRGDLWRADQEPVPKDMSPVHSLHFSSMSRLSMSTVTWRRW